MHFKCLQNAFDTQHLMASDGRQFISSVFYHCLLLKILLMNSVLPEAHFIYALYTPVVSMWSYKTWTSLQACVKSLGHYWLLGSFLGTVIDTETLNTSAGFQLPGFKPCRNDGRCRGLILKGMGRQQNSCKLRITIPCLKLYSLICAWQQYFNKNWSCLCHPPVPL